MGMKTEKDRKPELFEANPIDPVLAAIGLDEKSDRKSSSTEDGKNGGPARKKKAGFYLSLDVLDRFTRKFHEMKLAGITIENKSAFVEAAIIYALDDVDREEGSKFLEKFF
jgi:hypothetical protein